MLNRLYRIFACGVFFGLLFAPAAGEALYGNDLDTLTEKYRQARSSAGKPGTSAWQKDVAAGATRQPPVPANRKK